MCGAVFLKTNLKWHKIKGWIQKTSFFTQTFFFEKSGSVTSSTNNFSYTDASGWTNNTIAIATGATGFSASNKAKLNDCAAKTGDASSSNFNWKVTVKKSDSSEGDATFTATTNCTELTPNFGKIGK